MKQRLPEEILAQAEEQIKALGLDPRKELKKRLRKTVVKPVLPTIYLLTEEEALAYFIRNQRAV